MINTTTDHNSLSQLAKDEMVHRMITDIGDGKSATITVRGWSMRPLLNNLKDRAVICPITRELRVDDVVVFKYRDRWLLHRIVKIEGDTITIKGDGVPFNHEVVNREAVLAVMTKAIRRNGKIIECDSPEWINNSRRWNALNPNVQFVVLKVHRLFEKLRLI